MELTVSQINDAYAMIYLNGRKLESIDIKMTIGNYGNIDSYLALLKVRLENGTYWN